MQIGPLRFEVAVDVLPSGLALACFIELYHGALPAGLLATSSHKWTRGDEDDRYDDDLIHRKSTKFAERMRLVLWRAFIEGFQRAAESNK